MIHVAIDARLPAGLAGGVQHVAAGFAEGFRTAAPEALRRTWVVYPDYVDWLEQLLPPGDEVLVSLSLPERVGLRLARVWPDAVSRLRPAVERALSSRPGAGDGLRHDAELRRRGVQVVHLPFQDGLSTALPTIYHPHDLLHRHHPRFFTAAQITHREGVWRQKALSAAAVSVGTRWVAEDVQRQWAVPSDRIHVVPLAPLRTLLEPSDEVRQPDPGQAPVVLYPAAFWPHKNHVTLVRAAGILLRRGIDVRLQLPGSPTGEYARVRQALVEEGLDADRSLPGYLTDAELAAAYASAAVVCVPTRFESASFPIWEAFAAGVPVAASAVTALPEQVGDAGLLFEPDDVQGLADALQQLLTEPDLRQRLVAAGRNRIAGLTWVRTALATAGVYRRVLGQAPRPEEEAALTAGPRL